MKNPDNIELKLKRFSLSELLRDEILKEKCVVAIEELEQIADADTKKERFFLFVKTLYAYSELYRCGCRGVDKWKNLFVENLDVIDKKRDKVGEDTKGFDDMILYLYQRGTNSNTVGSGDKGIIKTILGIISDYSKMGDMEKAEFFLNPFLIKSGDEFFQIEDGGHNGKFQITKREIKDFVYNVNEADGIVSSSLGDISLFDFNKMAVGRQIMFRDGRNYFGGDLKKIKEEKIGKFKKGEKFKFSFETPAGTIEGYCEVLDTNETDLDEEFGLAYVPFAEKLLKLKVLIDGKEKEFILDDFYGWNKN